MYTGISKRYTDAGQKFRQKFNTEDAVEPPFFYLRYMCHPLLRMLTIPVVLQHLVDDKWGNVGHPRLVRVPNCVRVARLHALLAREVPAEFSLTLLEEATDRCSRYDTMASSALHFWRGYRQRLQV